MGIDLRARGRATRGAMPTRLNNLETLRGVGGTALISHHHGGTRVLLGDGAVNFVTDSIDAGN
ncbi:hypothetical protein LF1_47820 [Rubripirellula obstinata]|uniref:DUF1559 domain-containing protein n=1 Tax=Rubripirellula obstinata TaxID=406547 RepID=A0A5B1CRF7_9BACT|nr:hypothetical protein LF1_47820 [Rubripirellula obstinata]